MVSDEVFKKGKREQESKLNQVPGYANTIMHVLLILGCLFAILPLILVLSGSFSTESDLTTYGYSLIPRNFTTMAYTTLFGKGQVVWDAYLNTIIATLAGTVIALVTIGLYAYPLSRRGFRFSGFFTFVAFFTMLFSGGLVPFYIVGKQILGLGNTVWVLFLPMGFNVFWMIVMRTFYKSSVPEEVIESARIDGAGEWRTLLQIVAPLAIPGYATVALFQTIGIWNDFFMCLVFNDNVKFMNLQFFIYKTLTTIQFLKQAASSMGVANLQINIANLPSESFRMAMAIVTIGPIVLAYPFFQRFFLKGLTIGAIKG